MPSLMFAGTCVDWMPAARLNISLPTCEPVPMPGDPNFRARGVALPIVTRPSMLVIFDDALVTRTYAWLVSGAIAMKSFSGSYGRPFTNRAYACALEFTSNV